MKIACLTQLVNVIATIMKEPSGRTWVQGIYYPLLYASAYGRGVSLRPEVEVPGYTCAVRENVPYLDCAAVEDNAGAVTLFLVNRNETESIDGSISLDGFGSMDCASHITLTGCETKDLPCGNTAGGDFSFRLPPLSWNMVRLTAK